MNILIKQFKKLFYGVALSMYAAMPVLAADIEIFTDSNSAATTAQPNVLFIMDSSDSMRRIPGAAAAPGAPVAVSYDPTVTYPTTGTGSFAADKYYYRADGVAPTAPNANDEFDMAALQCNHAVVNYATGVIEVLSTSSVTDGVTGVTTTTTVSLVATGAARAENTVVVDDPGTPTDPDDDTVVSDTTVAATPAVATDDGPLNTVGFYSGQIAHVKPGNNAGQSVTWRKLDTNPQGEDYLVECAQDQGIHGQYGASSASEPYIWLGNGTNAWDASVDATLVASLWNEVSDNFATIYHPNYLNYLEEAPTTTVAVATGDSLFQTLKNAIGIIVAAATNINIGYMPFDIENTGSITKDGIGVDLNGDGDTTDSKEEGDVSDGAGTGGEGGGIRYQVQDVNLGRNNFYSGLKVLDAAGDAPLSEAYYEALKYFGGEAVDYGDGASPPTVGSATGTGNDAYLSPITDSCQKNVIIIVSSGQSSYDYINQTRRESLFGFDATSCGNTGGVDDYDFTNTNRSAYASDTATNDNCLDELSEWAFTDDVARRDVIGDVGGDSIDYSARHAGEQNITTYTVGYAFSSSTAPAAELAAAEQLLRDTAEKSGTEFIEAEDEAALVEALNGLLTSILKVNSTFSSPAVSVNAFNRSTHLNDLYFTLFKPDDAEHWTGNLKKFKLLFDSVDGTPFIADKNGDEAVNDTTGFFIETAQSFWSSGIDGDEAGVGGAANLIGNTGSSPVRKVYTLTGAYANGTGRTAGVKTPAVAGDKALSAPVNLLSTTNPSVTDAEFDTLLNITGHLPVIGAIAYRVTLLDWINGRDVFDEVSGSDSRYVMGDPLHAEPALIQYGSLAGVDVDGDGKDDPDLVTYMATNDGYLHAIDSRDNSPNDSSPSTGGTELWTFIPQEILPNMDALLEDDGSEGKLYGLDGSVVPWIQDVEKVDGSPGADGIINEVVHAYDPDQDHAYIYFGMRRGLENLQTRNYIYALDVTVPEEPQFKWMIEAGTGTYDEVGQTWSTINVEQIKVGNAERTVLMFGGGYDLAQDSVIQRTADSMGRAFYIVDAETGERLWSAGPPNADATTDHDLILTDMLYSIPARVKPLDINGDGFIDRIYMGDMGGQLWRFDIALSDATTTAAASNDASAELSDLVTGGRIANLATDGSITENRRFFYPPDVAFIVEEGVGAYLSILAASGNRAHPLQTDTHDRMYMIRDKNIYSPPPDIGSAGLDSDDYKALEVSDAVGEIDLHDATLNLVTGGTAGEITTAVTELADRKGWFMDLSEPSDSSFVGEKALSEPLIFSNVAIVTTFLPASAGYVSAAICEPNAGTAALYFVNIADGTPTYSSDDELGERADRRTLLKRGGIPPTPSIIITEDGTPTLTIGTEISDANANLNITKTYWYEVEDASYTISP